MADLQKWQIQILQITNNENYNLKLKNMKTVNSISGGMTSAYIAANYPADINQFALVRTNDKSCIFPDSKVRQIVSDRIGKEFVGTLENDTIIYTILDLEQFIGKEIHWLSGEAFEDIIRKRKALPNVQQRYCTTEMKIVPMKEFWYKNINEPVEVRIGFRANEQSRAKSMNERCREDGFIYEKFIVSKSENGRNKWKELKWHLPKYPLIEDAIFKDTIEKYWKDKPVRFSWKNNCVGCFHNNCMLLKHTSNREPIKYEWFAKMEREMKEYFLKKNGKDSHYARFLSNGLTYDDVKKHRLQLDLFDTDFNECDSGYCGL